MGFMAGLASIRMVAGLLLSACTAFCQQASRGNAASLPDAPSAQTSSSSQMNCAIPDTGRLSTDTPTLNAEEQALRYDPGHFDDLEQASRPSVTVPVPLKHESPYHASTSNSLIGRVGYAASSIVLTRDDSGKARVNTPYLLTVLTSAMAHSAYRPYWRRSATQPVSDFGSTVGSDAGINVFHEFEPGILQLVRNHEPRFVSKIESKVHR